MAAHRLEPVFKGKKKPDQADQAQEKNQDQGQASAQEPVKPKPEPARGKRPPADDYQNHPKFAKFSKGEPDNA